MNLKSLLNLLLINQVFCSFSMEIPSKEQKKEESIFANLPNEAKINILVQEIEIDPKLSILENFKTVLPNKINKIYNTFGYTASIKESSYIKNEIYKKISELIKKNYSKEDIENSFYQNSEMTLTKTNDIAEILLKTGLINQRIKNLSLYWAARHNNLELVKFLILNGADINFVDKHGRTALMAAVYYGSPQLISFMIDKGAQINVEGTEGSILHYAIISQQPNRNEIAKLLISKNADLKKLFRSKTPLEYARQMNKHEIVNMIEEKLKEQ